MKSKIIYITAIVLTILYSCYDDKGNYDYIELKTVEISNVYSNWSVPLGEPYEIFPEINYGDANEDDFEYLWIAEMDTISYSKNLSYNFFNTGRFRTVFMVIEKATGARTVLFIDLNVIATFQRGFVILTEKDGNSVIHYIRPKTTTIDENTQLYELEVFEDIYHNNYEDQLGSNPVRLICHYDSEDQILLVQNGGDGTLELSGVNFEKVITTELEFVGNTYPSGFVPLKASYGLYMDVIIGTNGDVYTRKKNSRTFQAVRYPNVAVNDMKAASLYMAPKSNFHLIHDTQNNCFMAVGELRQGTAGRIIKIEMDVEDESNSENFTDLSNLTSDFKLIYSGCYYNPGYNPYFQIVKKNNQYFMQEFNITSNVTEDVLYIVNGTEQLFSEGIILSDDTKYIVNGGQYIYFAEKNNLYYYDRSTSITKVYHQFEANVIITSICHGRDRNEVAVGLDNGEFYVFDVSTRVLASGNSETILRLENLGKVVDVIYKLGSNSNFESYFEAL